MGDSLSHLDDLLLKNLFFFFLTFNRSFLGNYGPARH